MAEWLGLVLARSIPEFESLPLSQNNSDRKFPAVTTLMHLMTSKLVCNKLPGGSTCSSPDPARRPDVPPEFYLRGVAAGNVIATDDGGQTMRWRWCRGPAAPCNELLPPLSLPPSEEVALEMKVDFDGGLLKGNASE